MFLALLVAIVAVAVVVFVADFVDVVVVVVCFSNYPLVPDKSRFDAELTRPYLLFIDIKVKLCFYKIIGLIYFLIFS